MPAPGPGSAGVAGEPGAGGGRGLGTSRNAAGLGTSRSAAGLGGMSIGAGRGRDEVDGVHKRPDYLVEPDAESLFGSDELTAPPVLGVA